MIERMVEMILVAVAAYSVLGALAAIPLHVSGLGRIDPAARGAGPWFRVLITPGILAFWPVLLMKWRTVSRGEDPVAPVEQPVRPESLRRLHGLLIQTLAIAIPVAVAAAILSRTPIHATGQPPLGIERMQLQLAPANTAH